MHPDHVQPVEQVGAEQTPLHFLFQISVGGYDQPEIQLNAPVAGQPLNGLFLNQLQKLGLNMGRQLADLIQKQRSVVGQLDLADLAALLRAREGALLIAEELALEEIIGDAGAVDRDKGILVAAALLVDGTRDELLTGAGLACDEYGRRAVGDALDDLLHTGDGRAGADDALEITCVLRGLVEVIGQTDEKARHLIVDHDGAGGYLRGRVADADALLI